MKYNIAIIGAGTAGLAFALSLVHSGLSILLIEKKTLDSIAKPQNDGREFALTHLSHKLLQQNGSWQRIGSEYLCPLQAAQVLDGDSPYSLDFDTAKAGKEALGYMAPHYRIRQALYDELHSNDRMNLLDTTEVTGVSTNRDGAVLTLDNTHAIQADLVVAADSRFSYTRQMMGISTDMHQYGRSAILCTVEHQANHMNTAIECFQYGGTLAALPMACKKGKHYSSIVLTMDSHKANNLIAMDETDFKYEIEQRLQGRLGQLSDVGERHFYPLVGVHANRFYANRFALIGDTAVGMHPVTAHGFNLGLAGQDLLAKGILSAIQKGQPFWQEKVLKRYEQQHMPNTRLLYQGTNVIVSLFTNEMLPAKLLRKAVIRLSNNIPPVKWAIRQKLMSKNHSLSLFGS